MTTNQHKLIALIETGAIRQTDLMQVYNNLVTLKDYFRRTGKLDLLNEFLKKCLQTKPELAL